MAGVVVNVPASSLQLIRKKVYYSAKSGMAVALCEHLAYITQHEEEILTDVLAQVVEEEGQRCTPLIIAARNGHERVVRVLLKFSLELEQEGTVKFDGYAIEGASALWCAAGAGHLSVVKLLVRSGANVNHTTRTNSTPVRAACFDGRLDIVKYLTEHEADIHITNKYNNTCLMIAAYKGHLDVVNYLLELEANPNEKAHCGATALHFAAECGHVKIVENLLDHGALVVSNEHNMTPLMAAAERACAVVVEFLILRDEVSEEESIDALELLGASYASDKDHYNLEQAFSYLERAMLKRCADTEKVIGKDLRTPVSAYGHHKECETMQELLAMRSLPTALHMEALAIRERILGPANPEVPPAVIFRGAVFADNARFDRCLQLWLHALRLKLAAAYTIGKDLLRFAQVFSQMVHVGVELDVVVVVEVLEAVVVELTRNHAKIDNPGPKDDVIAIKEDIELNMITSLYLIMIAQRICKSSTTTTSSLNSILNNNNINNNNIVNNNLNNNNNNNNNNLAFNNDDLGFVNVNDNDDNHHGGGGANNAGLAWGDMVANDGGGGGGAAVLGNIAARGGGGGGGGNTKKGAERSAACNEREMKLHTVVYRLIRTNSRTTNGQTLLHLSVSPDTPVDDFHTNLICRFPCASTTKLLLTCGADANAEDNCRNTPLHLIVPYKKPISDFLTLHNIILGLVEAHAHMDTVNQRGLTPYQACTSGVAEIILRTQHHPRLQCIAARVIVSAGLTYQSLVPRHLEAFIQLHATPLPPSGNATADATASSGAMQ